MGKIAVNYAVNHPDRVMALLLSQYRDVFQGTRLGLQAMAMSDWTLMIQTSARMGWPHADSSTVVPISRGHQPE